PVKAANLAYLTQLDDGGTQGYHGVLVSSTWKLGTNFTLNGNYTWSHCVGLPITTLSNSANGYIHQPYQNNGPENRRLDYGDCSAYLGVGGSASLDVRHITNITLVASTPRFSGDLARRLGTGWTASTIVQIRSGT